MNAVVEHHRFFLSAFSFSTYKSEKRGFPMYEAIAAMLSRYECR